MLLEQLLKLTPPDHAEISELQAATLAYLVYLEYHDHAIAYLPTMTTVVHALWPYLSTQHINLLSYNTHDEPGYAGRALAGLQVRRRRQRGCAQARGCRAGEGLLHIRLQPPPHTVAASFTYGCSLLHIRLQPPPHTVAGARLPEPAGGQCRPRDPRPPLRAAGVNLCLGSGSWSGSRLGSGASPITLTLTLTGPPLYRAAGQSHQAEPRRAHAVRRTYSNLPKLPTHSRTY
eukprot:scaffold37063_cov54-Phaeocystis_antarctica.AAC.5